MFKALQLSSFEYDLKKKVYTHLKPKSAVILKQSQHIINKNQTFFMYIKCG